MHCIDEAVGVPSSLGVNKHKLDVIRHIVRHVMPDYDKEKHVSLQDKDLNMFPR